MYYFFLVALLFTLLLEPVAAASPVLDLALPVAPMETHYGDPDGLLAALCQFCIGSCTCPTPTLQRAPTFTPATFLEHPEWPQDGNLGLIADSPEPEQEPLPQTITYMYNRPLLLDENVRSFDQDATTIQRSTIQSYLETTYTPGDRTLGGEGRSRRPPTRRQAPRPGGFPCSVKGCDRTFNRSCDLNRHYKTHQPRSERPHKCSVCNEGFLYPKDRNRHEQTHDQSVLPQATLYCYVPGCSNVNGFSRRDNLLRHQRKQHRNLIAT